MGPLILRDHQWRIRLDLLAETVVAPPEQLRPLCGAPDCADIPDDLLIAAAATGASSTAAFLDILDGGCFVGAPCLCCYSVRSPEHMREAIASLRLFRTYHNPDTFVVSRAFGRAVATLSRDLRPEEIVLVQKRLARLDSTPETIREVHRLARGVCIAAPACHPKTLWVYSTPDGRKLLRHLTRTLRRAADCGALSVTVASSDPGALPRFRFRMYAATLCAAEAPAAADLLLSMVLEWAKSHRSHRPKRE